MGGTSFGQSQSLITVQHRAFEEWCASQLSGVSLEVRSFRYLLDKEVHGDLDLICAYDGIEMPRSAKGNNAGRLDADGSEIDPPNKLTREQQSVRDVYVEIARALKAYAWHRSTFDVPVLSLAVRCREVPPIARLVNLENGIDPSSFYQIDLNLVRPAVIPFFTFGTSHYLQKIMRNILQVTSRSIVLQQEQLLLEHKPFGNVYPLPPIRISMTTDPVGLCRWLGLEYERWLNRPFINEAEFFSWLIDVPQASVLAVAYERIGKGAKGPNDDKHLCQLDMKAHLRWLAFKEWLKSSPNSKWSGADLSSDTIGSPLEEIHNPIDTEHPFPLDKHAAAAANYWGIEEAYQPELVKTTLEARRLADSWK